MLRKITFVIIALCTCFNVSAQVEHASANVWKRTVSRIIDAPQQNSGSKEDTIFAEMIIRAVRAGKTPAYSAFDAHFSHRLTMSEILGTDVSPIDTQFITDPKTGKDTFLTPSGFQFNFTTIKKYRILEDWIFDPHTGKTDIQINGIAPMLDVYGDDGVYRGSRAMFWLRFKDVRTLLARYDRKHPNNSFTGQIWRNYFSGDVNANVLHQSASRLIDMAEKEDTAERLLWNLNPIGAVSIFDTIFHAITYGNLAAWSNADFTKPLKRDHLFELLDWGPDTILVNDPVTGKEEIKIVHYDFNLGWYHKYRILEDWTFDPANWKTEINITGIGPVKEKYNSNGSVRFNGVMFWLRYNDVKPIIDFYEQYNPNNTIAGHIWNDYFLSDIKPQVLK